MCTIDPLMCWYYDHKEYWLTHLEEYEIAEAIINTGVAGRGKFVDQYARMAKLIEKHK